MTHSFLVLPTLTLWQREMVRFLRQRHRVASALLTPIILWIFLGAGMNHAFTIPTGGSAAEVGSDPATHHSYMQYFFPGTAVFIVLSTAIFSTISVIEDRREGFLQSVLTAPVSRWAIVLGKVLGGATLATGQAFLFLLLWPTVIHNSPHFMAVGWTGIALDLLLATVAMAILSIALTALGLCIAWPMNSTAGFHAVMMIFLMPMWFLSGAVFPLTGAPAWLKVLMLANPLTYGQAATASYLTADHQITGVPLAPFITLILTAVFALLTLMLAVKLVSKPRKDGLA